MAAQARIPSTAGRNPLVPPTAAWSVATATSVPAAGTTIQKWVVTQPKIPDEVD
jgi:hypothetical protein